MYGIMSNIKYNFTAIGSPTYLEMDYSNLYDYFETGALCSNMHNLNISIKMTMSKYVTFNYIYKLYKFDSTTNKYLDYEKGEFSLKIEYCFPIRKDVNFAGNLELN